MHLKSFKSIDELIQGISGILSKHRCSFSIEEQVLLETCIRKLEFIKLNEKSPLSMGVGIQVVEILLKIFIAAGHLKNLFD
ncbi:hypothetical protein EDD80_1184 [Anseongella ginsenosidimutans]|uniref:Uncharacterized protein n=1 Tax=Anseongella ginsenosidimutans TaxID=496056 RepID=A0A4R3KNP7_9SPHI|nr:hypothetical protein EDD80_1184 [Anseongella ginsenosidimutans]